MSIHTDPRERAEDLLCHYLRTVWEAAGLTWDNWDNRAEVGIIVDSIIDAAKDVSHVDRGANCDARDRGYSCTVGTGHLGDHIAHGTKGDVIHTWPPIDAEVAP